MMETGYPKIPFLLSLIVHAAILVFMMLYLNSQRKVLLDLTPMEVIRIQLNDPVEKIPEKQVVKPKIIPPPPKPIVKPPDPVEIDPIAEKVVPVEPPPPLPQEIAQPEPVEPPVIEPPQRVVIGLSGTPDLGDLDPFKRAVLAHIRRFQNYPKPARERGIEGLVHLQFIIDAKGTVESVEVLPPQKSHPLLEQAALETIRKASPLPRVPEKLRQAKEIILQLTMQYQLK